MAKRKKKSFSTTEDIRNELKDLYELDSGDDLTNYSGAADEVKPIKDLSPDSIEFKKRINNENFNYFMEISEIYAQEMLAAKLFLQSEKEKQAFLDAYFKELERSKEIFQKLIARGMGTTQPTVPLQAVQLERLQRVEKRIDTGIELINNEIKFWGNVLETLNDDISALTAENKLILNQTKNILQDYAASIASSDVFVRVPITLTLTSKEREKLGAESWSDEVKLEANDLHTIAMNFAAKVGSGEVLYRDQSDFIYAEVQTRLYEKVKEASDKFLTGDEQTNFVERNMNTSQATKVMGQYVDMLSRHYAEQDAKHGNLLKLNAVRLGEVNARLDAAMQKREKVINIVDELNEQKNSLIATKERLLAARQNKSTSQDLSSEIKNAQSALTRLAERMTMVEKAHDEFGQQKEKEADETLSVRHKAF